MDRFQPDVRNAFPPPASRRRHRMIDRIAEIMEIVARSDTGVTLTELARTLDAPLSSIQGLVNGLVGVGYLDERDRRYHLGSAPYLLNLLQGRHLVTSVNHATVAAISEELELTALLAVAVGDGVFYIDIASSAPRYEYLAKNYVKRSLIGTSSGWVLMAGMARRDLWSYLSSIQNEHEQWVDRFFAEMETIQQTGLCILPGVSDVADGIAIAVVEDGRTVAAVSVVGDRDEMLSRRDEIAATLSAHRERWQQAGAATID